ncbi:AAA family ATPase [Demequina rhizosphaerae]|uniref:AAA family ATPase n=1 Tax=Demequina rhizosphaerae TaxID=1638985 RepID=UPI000783DDCB|nr:AAA family ATPase [Demequina rhizosphaerae]
MRLQSITLNNFRQFRGTQTFDLTSTDLKPVSLLFGANGAGKTTLLNAFTWALYGSLSEDVEHQERLATDSVYRAAAMGSVVEASVELAFDHEGQDYRVLRRTAVRKEGDAQPKANSTVQVWTTTADGSSNEVSVPQEKILSILPRSISRFFFFNGERIEKLVEKTAYSEVQKDIKVLLDLEQVDRALVDLPRVDRKIAADIRKHGGDKAASIQATIDKLQEDQAEFKEELQELESNVASLTREREDVADLLRQHDAAAPIQRQRDATTRDLADARKRLQDAHDRRDSLIASRGFLAFTADLCTGTADMATSLYEKGALPAPLKREFVDQLLSDGVCICGTELSAHGPHWQQVTEWRQRAGLQAVESAWQRLDGLVDPMSKARTDLKNAMGDSVRLIGDLRDTVAHLEEKKSELDAQLRDNRAEDVQGLESKRIDLDTRIGNKQRRIGQLQADIQRTAQDTAQKMKERQSAEVHDELAVKARARSEMVRNVQSALEEIRDIRSERMRTRLDEELKRVYGSISYKNYVPSLSPSFELTLHTEVGGVLLPVGKSTGENQILSLSFVAAVSKLARELRAERHAEGNEAPDSGTYPIVMDAAFGSLDQNYQEAVARSLASMAPQLVVLVSKSQGLGKVVEQLDSYVSHFGVIEAHTSLPDAADEEIELHGYEYPYIRHDDDDFTVLREMKR